VEKQVVKQVDVCRLGMSAEAIQDTARFSTISSYVGAQKVTTFGVSWISMVPIAGNVLLACSSNEYRNFIEERAKYELKMHSIMPCRRFFLEISL